MISSHLTQFSLGVQKARKAFGSIYAFQGALIFLLCRGDMYSPHTPVENWVLSPESIRMFESFQGEIAKRILQLPKWYSNTAAIVALGQNSLHSVYTIRKLRFLHRVMTNEQSICHRAFSAMVDDVESLSLVRECRELEERYKTNFTSAILSATDQDELDIIRTAQKSINKINQSLFLHKVSKYPFLHKIAECIG